MKNIFCFILTIASLFLVNSCEIEGDIATNAEAICHVVDGELVPQDGINFIIVENQCGTDWLKYEMVYVIYDVLSVDDIFTYNIRLKSFEPIFVKDVIVKSEAGEAVLREDPLYLASGPVLGYEITTNVLYTTKKGSDAKHEINLVFDDERSTADSVFFFFSHDASGDYYKEGDKIEDYEIKNEFFSFDLTEFFKNPGQKTMVASFWWNWYEMDSYGRIISPKTEPAHGEIDMQSYKEN